MCVIVLVPVVVCVCVCLVLYGGGRDGSGTIMDCPVLCLSRSVVCNF